MMADSRGGLGSLARNGNSAARTYGAGIRPTSREDGLLRVAGGGGARPRVAAAKGGASGKPLAGAATAGADRSPSAGDGGADAGDPDLDPDLAPDPAARGATHRILEARGSQGYHESPRSTGLCGARRAVLLGFAAGGAALLAGCGGDDEGGDGGGGDGNGRAAPASQPASDASRAAEPPLEPFPGADDGGGDTGGGDGLVKTGDVPVGGAVLADNYLIAQPQRGVFKAFDATCPHQGITVDAPIGSNDYFICPGHNSKFRLADGSRISGPAPRGLKQIAVKVRNGFVVEA
jgi:nitrite reductase/ring-hydroxylating ferredoxin subunit